MVRNEYTFRVSYSDTDKMQVLHHSNYARYCENARWELFREMGTPYDEIEAKGYMLPVFTMNSTFAAPAKYDEKIRIITSMDNCKGVRIGLCCRFYNMNNIMINETEIMLACVDRETFKPCPLPGFILDAVKNHELKQSLEGNY